MPGRTLLRMDLDRWRKIIWWGCAADTFLCLVFAFDGQRGSRLISPDSEFSPSRGSIVLPVLISVFMSLMSGIAWFEAGRREEGRSRRGVLLGLGVFFTYMALDDFFAFHEYLDAHLHIDWEKLYLPLVAAAGVCVLFIAKYYWRSCRAAVLWLMAGGGMWFIAEVLEFAEWHNSTSQTMPLDQYLKYGPYVAMMIPEEILECVGSGVWVIGAIALLQHLADRSRSSLDSSESLPVIPETVPDAAGEPAAHVA